MILKWSRIKINDPYKATYGVVNAEAAVTAIAQTAMRSEIGKLSLDGIFSERDGLNTKIVNAINEASMEWGLHCLRYEIRDIEVLIYKVIFVIKWWF